MRRRTERASEEPRIFSHIVEFRSHPKADGKVGVARRKVGKGGLRETRLKNNTIRKSATDMYISYITGITQAFPQALL